MINPRFQTYFHERFFLGKPEEESAFLAALTSPIHRTIRIRPGYESQVAKRLGRDGWILTPTPIDRVFRVTRDADFDPYERRLGMSLDHLVGNFYIQELAAAHPVDILADGAIHRDPLLILDMASSPWGKTTQISEYFPNAHIIASEPWRERIPQLLQNLERMHTPNISVTLYPGQYWQNLWETFDRILLDAPCSGEWTLYKWTDAVHNWHIKSIKRIATLQKRLLESALYALKPGGEMVYSTCALNDIENEGVITHIREKFGDALSISYEKKFWPHIDHTGGFYIAKIHKHDHIIRDHHRNIHHESNTEVKRYAKSIRWWNRVDDITLYRHMDKILAVRWSDTLSSISEKIFIMRMWEYIWDLSWDVFIPRARAFRYILPDVYSTYTISDEAELDMYLRWYHIPSVWDDGYILMQHDGVTISIEQRLDNTISNRFPREWQRGK